MSHKNRKTRRANQERRRQDLADLPNFLNRLIARAHDFVGLPDISLSNMIEEREAIQFKLYTAFAESMETLQTSMKLMETVKALKRKVRSSKPGSIPDPIDCISGNGYIIDLPETIPFDMTKEELAAFLKMRRTKPDSILIYEGPGPAR